MAKVVVIVKGVTITKVQVKCDKWQVLGLHLGGKLNSH